MSNELLLLAIVIPYYKKNYFEELLDTLAKQTNNNFKIYVGDDNSSKSPLSIIKNYTNLCFSYKKFNKNLGKEDLVAQWHRCLDMVQDEEWIWMLPDDDVPSYNVVEEFYQALQFQKKYQIKVFRFPLSFIDHKGRIVKEGNNNDPLVETNLEFYQRVVMGKTAASLGDNIFHKKSLLENGGFVNFPKAWGSDHATILQASTGGSIYFLSKARLHFRMSGKNISSDSSDGTIKIQAKIAFAKWLKEHEEIFPEKPDKGFYKYFYWKGEYYALYEWQFIMGIWIGLYRLRIICINSYSPFPLCKLILMRLLKS